MTSSVVIGLSAVVCAAGTQGPEVLLSGRAASLGLPFGSFDPIGHRTFELAVRDFVTAQTGFALGYVEQLYTFGDKGREAPVASMGEGADGARVVSVGYLALTSDTGVEAPRAGQWRDWYRFFPWEMPHNEAGKAALDHLIPALTAWARDRETTDRIASAFGLCRAPWQEARVLERYELLYEASLIVEARRDFHQAFDDCDPILTGVPLVSDHRRILATAIGRLRAKVRYRPVVFDLAPPVFTLSALQDLIEQICGVSLHKQNFRRMLEQSGLVEPTGDILQQTGGRPAKLYARTLASHGFSALGLSLPLLRR